MGTAPSRSLREPVPAGVIDTIGNAFTLVNRRPYLVAFIVFLDLLLWLGPVVDGGALLQLLRNQLVGAQLMPASEADAFVTLLQPFNLLALLALLTPSLITSLGADTFARPLVPPAIVLAPGSAAGTALACFLLGVTAGMGFLTLVATFVRGERIRGRAWGRATLRNTAALLAYYSLLILAIIGTATFLGAILLVASLFRLDQVLMAALALILTGVGIVIYLGLFFVEEAIAFSSAGPFRAVLLSVGILRVTPWPTIRFIVTVTLIQLGLPLALHVFTANSLAVPFALLSHAYVMTGLIVAAFLFYRERLLLLVRQESQRTVKAEDRK